MTTVPGPGVSRLARLARLAWLVAAVAGLVQIALMLWLAPMLPAAGCPPAEVAGPFGAFQAAKTAEQIWAIFGGPSPCRDALVAAMDRIDRIDLAAYIAGYGLALLAFLAGGRHPRRRIAFWLGLAALAIAVVGDVVETSAQLSITAQISGQPGAAAPALSAQSLRLLAVGYTAKTNALTVVFLALAWQWIGRGLFGTLLALILLTGPALRLYGLIAPVPPPVGLAATLVRSVVMELTAIGMAVAAWLAARRSQRSP